jgi:hypothetical protein
MKNTLKGPFIIVTNSGHVFGASSVETTPKEFIIKLNQAGQQTIEHRLNPKDISVVYEVDPSHQAAQINPGILSTVAALERLMLEFAEKHPPHLTTLFGSASLALTMLPDRSTNDLDAIASDEFVKFVNEKDHETDIEIELLDEKLLRLLGPWATRTSELRGPLGLPFRIVHPLDTVMQKLLRYSEAQFVTKDQGDIENVITCLRPTKETLINLLTENPSRYARLAGSFATQADAIERNTQWFLGAYVPEVSFKDVLEKTGDRAMAPMIKAGFLPTVDNVDFRDFIKKSGPEKYDR